MRRLRAACLLALLPAGCLSGPLTDNPMRVGGEPAVTDGQNPVVLKSGRPPSEAYEELFDQALDAVDDFFTIAYANRYEGRILGRPTIAPGFEQIWKPGSMTHYGRSLATLQAYRYRCELKIREADPSGYFVEVLVRKDLRDYPSPATPTTIVPVFGDAMTMERDAILVVTPEETAPVSTGGERWIPKGREVSIEQTILNKLRRCD